MIEKHNFFNVQKEPHPYELALTSGMPCAPAVPDRMPNARAQATANPICFLLNDLVMLFLLVINGESACSFHLHFQTPRMTARETDWQ